MFEILRAYETALAEKNSFLRFIYKAYVKILLKHVFFKKFKRGVKDLKLDKNLIDEFSQFFMCIEDTYDYKICVRHASLSTQELYIRYYMYDFKFKFHQDYCDVEIQDNSTSKTVMIHPNNDKFYSSTIFSTIILIAIYNYCVAYIYGMNSDLFINNSCITLINYIFF